MLRRLLFVEQNTDGTIGGSHKCLLNLIKYLDRKKYECRAVFYENNSMVQDFSELCDVSLFSAPTRLSSPNFLLRKISNGGYLLLDLMRIALFLRKCRPDLIHLNNSICVGYDTWAAAGKALRIPVVTHERSYYDEEIMRKLARHSKVFKKIFCVSEAIRERCLSFGVSSTRLFTMYEGIEIGEFRARLKRSRESVRSELGIAADKPVIGIVGNIRRWKGQDVVLRALRKARTVVPDIHCIIIGAVGDGIPRDQEYFKELRKFIDEHHLSSAVSITGFRDDIPDLLNAIDVQIHASVTMEPFGIVILEGMSLGVPIIASRAGGPSEIVEDGKTGLLCTPGDSESMADCIIRLLRSPGLRENLRKAALDRIERFDLQRYVSEMSNHYDALIETG